MLRLILGTGNQILSGEDRATMKVKVEEAIKVMFKVMGYNWQQDSNMRDTPKRMARMYIDELCAGNYIAEPKFTVFPNDRENSVDEMILIRNIEVKSICSHHWMPFVGKANIAYIPGKTLCGVSKLSRVVKWFMRRPQIQEALTNKIAQFLTEKLNPLGVAVVVEAQHMCMTMRGVNEFDSTMVTSKLTGVFKEKVETRNEFLALIGKR